MAAPIFSKNMNLSNARDMARASPPLMEEASPRSLGC